MGGKGSVNHIKKVRAVECIPGTWLKIVNIKVIGIMIGEFRIENCLYCSLTHLTDVAKVYMSTCIPPGKT